MSRHVKLTMIALVMWAVALWLLSGVNWRVAIGVFLFVWANNLVYTTRLQKLGVVPGAGA